MANYTFTTYWVEGTKEAIHQLHDAIANADGWTSKARARMLDGTLI